MPALSPHQRTRLVPWVQAKRNVPCSYSRLISGAPRNIPASTNSTMMASETESGKAVPLPGRLS